MQSIPGGQSSVNVSEDRGEPNNLHLRRPQRHKDRHGIIWKSNPQSHHEIQNQSINKQTKLGLGLGFLTNARVGVDDDLLLLNHSHSATRIPEIQAPSSKATLIYHDNFAFNPNKISEL